MVNEDEETPPRHGIKHDVSPSYTYIVPAGYLFLHDPVSGRVVLTYYHDELRVVEETIPTAGGRSEYVTAPIRVQDVSIAMSQEDYMRSLRFALDGIAAGKPGLLEEFGVMLKPIKEE